MRRLRDAGAVVVPVQLPTQGQWEEAEQVVLLHLLGEAHQPDQVTVRIGTEIPYEELQATSIVSAAWAKRSRRNSG